MTDTPPGSRSPRLPGYSALERVGRGGFSSVYKSRQDTLSRDVAVKILLTDLTDEHDERRFRTESLVEQQLHPLGHHPVKHRTRAMRSPWWHSASGVDGRSVAGSDGDDGATSVFDDRDNAVVAEPVSPASGTVTG